MKPIYLDHASATPLDPRVLEAMLPVLRESGHPGSPHSSGRRAREMLERARGEVAELVGSQRSEVVFTASATEANNLALKGVCRARGRREPSLLISAVEHPSVLHPARTLASQGVRVAEISVDARGELDLEALRRHLRNGATLVSVVHGSPEVGTIQPLPEISRLAKESGALIHSDAALTGGFFPGLWERAGLDLMTLSSSLIHGPAGIGALVVRSGIRIKPQQEGGTQEGGLRAGTEALALAVGFGIAARRAREEASARVGHLRDLAAELRRRLEERLADWVPTGHPVHRVPGHLSLCLRYVEGEAVVTSLDDEGILAGSGSPCTREATKESHVLRAMGIDPLLARGALTLSFGAFSQREEAAKAARILPPVVERLRQISPLTPSPPGHSVRKGAGPGR